MSPEIVQKIESLPQATVQLIDGFINSETLKSLSEFRKDLETGDVDGHNEALLFHLRGIYTAFEPIALRLVYWRARRFTFLQSQDREDIYGSQKRMLWEVIAVRFNWTNYKGDSSRAGPSLLKYINKATGSSFATQFIERQGLVNIDMKQTGDWGQNPERQFLRQEKGRDLAEAIDRWKTGASPLDVRTLAMRVDDGLTVKEIAREERVGESAIKRRISRAKNGLIIALRNEETRLK